MSVRLWARENFCSYRKIDIVALENASDNAKCQLIFHNTLLTNINDLIKLHVRFIDNKKKKTKEIIHRN